MKPIYLGLLNVGLAFLRSFLSSLTDSKAPAEVIDAIQASIAALEKHKDDVMSKADWEQHRG